MAYRWRLICEPVYPQQPSYPQDTDTAEVGAGNGPQATKAERVVIACISGRGGVGPSGIRTLRDQLRSLLHPYGVPVGNIFSRSWNHNQDENPVGTPWVSDLLREINRRSRNPSYLALIGHSYGGWASCQLSRATSRTPDFIGLIDPVFGPANMPTYLDVPRGKKIVNWYQNNGIIGGDPCTGFGKVPCYPAQNGVACGYQHVPGAESNIAVEFLRNSNGERKRVSCLGQGHVHLLTSHVNIDDDEWIHSEIMKQVQADVSKIV